MADWNYIQCGYNALDETINFGTRILGGFDNLYETSTFCLFFSINKSLRIFQDLHCTELSLNITFEDIIDTFCVTSSGTFLFDIENEPKKLFQRILYEKQPFFIKAVPVESKIGLTFYVVSSSGQIHRIAQSDLEDININSNDNSDSYSENLAVDLNKPILHVNLLYPIMCCTNLEEVFVYNMALDRMTSFCISGIKKMHLCNIRFCLGLTCDGRLISICTKTGLKVATKINTIFEDSRQR
ncbi:hypothetical protein RI129_001242 [Pyrocoelia pectoralis]|uniref:Uncharacterized protein n=1 Tax=Pyrocoelia pectoralis TaxID=417401 RepID=A0AAN7ZWW5_9COLE